MTSRLGRVSLLVAVVALACWISAAPASAAPLSVTVTPSTVTAGQDFVVSGAADCITGTTLTVSIPALSLSDSKSAEIPWHLTFTVPDTAEAGTYPIVITGQECTYAEASITVVGPTTTTVAPTTTAPAAEAPAVAAEPAFTG